MHLDLEVGPTVPVSIAFDQEEPDLVKDVKLTFPIVKMMTPDKLEHLIAGDASKPLPGLGRGVASNSLVVRGSANAQAMSAESFFRLLIKASPASAVPNSKAAGGNGVGRISVSSATYRMG